MKFAQIFKKILPLRSHNKLTGNTIIAFSYKSVSDEYLPHVRHLCKVKSVSQFELELDEILKYYQPVSIRDLSLYISENKEFKENKCLLVFEDCLKDSYETIFPVLARRKVPAVFFADSRFIDAKELYYRHKASLLVDAISKDIKLIHKLTNRFSSDFWELRSEIFDIIMSVSDTNCKLLDEIAIDINFDYNEFLKVHSPYLTKEHINKIINSGFSCELGFFEKSFSFYNDSSPILLQIENGHKIFSLLCPEKAECLLIPYHITSIKNFISDIFTYEKNSGVQYIFTADKIFTSHTKLVANKVNFEQIHSIENS